MAEEITSYKLNHRQSKLIPPERLLEYTPVVIGLGNVGRQVALCLARMGAQNVILVDHDTVEAENCYPQGYPLSDIGLHKATACADDFNEHIMPGVDYGIKVATEKFDAAKHLPNDPTKAIIFCCVDSIDTRRDIFNETVISRGCPLFIDGRVGGEAVLVFATTPETAGDYAKTLFPASERVEAPCGARSTIYTGMLAAGFMCYRLAAWLRGLEFSSRMALTLYDDDISFPEFDNAEECTV